AAHPPGRRRCRPVALGLEPHHRIRRVLQGRTTPCTQTLEGIAAFSGIFHLKGVSPTPPSVVIPGQGPSDREGEAPVSVKIADTAEQSDSPVKVVFIGGLGRSGTTLLERLLGQLPGVMPLGEITHLWERDLLGNEMCACG